MENSILKSLKKVLGFDPAYTAFDEDIILFTNGVFSVLTQLGIGPDEGFMIEDDQAVWNAFLGDNLRLNMVKNYTFLKVKLNFDPPATSFAINMIEEQIKELEWRISTEREGADWTPPVAVPLAGGN